MITLRKLATAWVPAILVAIWIWSLWILAPTAGALGTWDAFCLVMLDASALAALLWVLRQREKKKAAAFFVFARILSVIFLSLALYAVHRRPHLAEIELRLLGIVPEKADDTGSFGWILRKMGLQVRMNTGRWVSNYSGNDRGDQQRLSRMAQLLSISGVTELGLYDEGRLTDIRPLRQLHDLKSLSVRCGQETDYHTLAELPKLTQLYLDVRASKPDLSPLQHALKLEALHIDANGDSMDLSRLKAPPNLQDLHLTGLIEPRDGAFLPSSKTLRKLSIKGALTLDRFTSAGAMPNLTELTLNGGHWLLPWTPDLSAVPRLAPNLSHLVLDQVNIETPSPLANLPRLATLHLIDCDAPPTFPGLPRMPALKTLSVRDTPFVTIASLTHSTPNLFSLRIAQSKALLALDALHTLTNLDHLDVSECVLMDLDEHLAELGKIRDVRLSGGKYSAKK